ncbi:MAG: hypothetical protein MZU97_24645 [Bacillus subtilis]|nr:hypothetical protein [Bacillus subtilis]
MLPRSIHDRARDEVTSMKRIRAVNLGGWFVLERWMKPSPVRRLDHPEARCETSLRHSSSGSQRRRSKSIGTPGSHWTISAGSRPMASISSVFRSPGGCFPTAFPAAVSLRLAASLHRRSAWT